MNLEKLGVKVAAAAGVAAEVAHAVVGRLPEFIGLADDAAELVGDGLKALKGSDKLALVRAMAKAALAEAAPEQAEKFANIWTLLGPVVTILVQLRKFGLLKF